MIKNTFKQIIANINDYLLLIMSLMVVFGAIIYYLYALNILGLIISMLLVIAVFIVLMKKYSLQHQINVSQGMFKRKNLLFPLIYLLFFGVSVAFLCQGQSDRALISPWDVVDRVFFVFYGLSTVALIVNIVRKETPLIIKLGLISLHYFLNLVVAVIVYKIGYGFDPFVHQATMELINKAGVVTPKHPYYLGQYSLILMLHKITGVSIYFLNKVLVPLLAAIFLPLNFWRFLKYQNKSAATATLITLVILPVLSFTPFIMTTPQNLSYLFLLLTILMGLNGSHYFWVALLSLATLAIHPLAGIPALAWSMWTIFVNKQQHFKLAQQKLITWGIALFTAIFLPASLLLVGKNSLKDISFNVQSIFLPLKNIFLGMSSAGRENFLLNFIYFFQSNLNVFIVLIIIISLIYCWRNTKAREISTWKGLFIINLSLVLAYILSSQITFANVIGYEQSNYAERILIMIVIFCLPCIILTLKSLVDRIVKQNREMKIIWLIFTAIILTSALYMSYPRFDKYFNSRGYSISENDLQTVRLIDNEADDKYVVLANQQVGVAALKEIGFNHYYTSSRGQIYFYSIPTGGPLYQYYLDMVYKNPTTETMMGAMNLAGVNEGYLVVNKYWHQSDRIIGEAKLVADDYEVINDDIYIFKYLR